MGKKKKLEEKLKRKEAAAKGNKGKITNEEKGWIKTRTLELTDSKKYKTQQDLIEDIQKEMEGKTGEKNEKLVSKSSIYRILREERKKGSRVGEELEKILNRKKSRRVEGEKESKEGSEEKSEEEEAQEIKEMIERYKESEGEEKEEIAEQIEEKVEEETGESGERPVKEAVEKFVKGKGTQRLSGAPEIKENVEGVLKKLREKEDEGKKKKIKRHYRIKESNLLSEILNSKLGLKVLLIIILLFIVIGALAAT